MQSDQEPPVIETPVEVTEAVSTKQKMPRTAKQLEALQAARSRAMQVRAC